MCLRGYNCKGEAVSMHFWIDNWNRTSPIGRHFTCLSIRSPIYGQLNICRRHKPNQPTNRTHTHTHTHTLAHTFHLKCKLPLFCHSIRPYEIRQLIPLVSNGQQHCQYVVYWRHLCVGHFRWQVMVIAARQPAHSTNFYPFEMQVWEEENGKERHRSHVLNSLYLTDRRHSAIPIYLFVFLLEFTVYVITK